MKLTIQDIAVAQVHILKSHFHFSLVDVNVFITEEGLTTLMIGFHETGETIEQEDVEDIEGTG